MAAGVSGKNVPPMVARAAMPLKDSTAELNMALEAVKMKRPPGG
jgi:hypothetical protein